MNVSPSPTDQILAPSDPPASRGPGRRLREAREAAGLSLDEVSTRLHLDRRTLERLEADEFEDLPAPTFVRGYLRSYARLLNLPAAPIVEAFDRLGLEPPALVADIATDSEARSTDFPVMLVTLAVVIVLVALAAVWWQGQQSGEPPELVGAAPGMEQLPPLPGSGSPSSRQPFTADDPGRAAGEGSGAPAPEGEPGPASREEALSLGEERPGDGTGAGAFTGGEPGPGGGASEPSTAALAGPGGERAPSPRGVGPTAQAPPPSPEGGTVSASGGIALELAPPGETSEGGTGREASAGTPSDADREQAPAGDLRESGAVAAAGTDTGPGATPGQAPAPVGRLTLRFERDAWVEVYDAHEQRLYYNLARAGSRVEVEGQTPLRVLLGYVRGVSVEYNGKPFDFSPYVSRGIARFQVGGGVQESDRG